MTVTIDLPPALARRLKELAARHSQEPAEYVRWAVEEKLRESRRRAAQATLDRLDAGFPRRDPGELLELARQQGAPVAARFEELQGDFWPEEESTDEVLATLRQWRREQQNARKR